MKLIVSPSEMYREVKALTNSITLFVFPCVKVALSSMLLVPDRETEDRPLDGKLISLGKISVI